jgi:hypothetical protein
MINSGFSYIRKVSTGVDMFGDFFGVKFDFSIDTKHIRKATEDKESIFAQMESLCTAYKLTMHTYDHPAVDPNFLAGVKSLPLEYDEDAYMTFLRTFGTNVVTGMTLGGRWGWQMEFKLDDYKSMMDDSISVGIYLAYAGKVKAGFNITHSEDTKLYMRVMSSISKNYSFNVGGTFSPDVLRWEESVRSQPMPVHMTLMSVSDLFTESYVPAVENLTTRKANIVNATKGYCQYLNRNVDPSVNCTPPAPIPMPTPAPPAKNMINGVCVRNSGGYALKFDELIPGTPRVATSDTYTAGNNRCLVGDMIDAQFGDTLTCRVHIIAGISKDCDGDGFKFKPTSKLLSNYECTGSTTIVRCRFTGLSNVPGDANAGVVGKLANYGNRSSVASPMLASALAVETSVAGKMEGIRDIII